VTRSSSEVNFLFLFTIHQVTPNKDYKKIKILQVGYESPSFWASAPIDGASIQSQPRKNNHTTHLHQYRRLKLLAFTAHTIIRRTMTGLNFWRKLLKDSALPTLPKKNQTASDAQKTFNASFPYTPLDQSVEGSFRLVSLQPESEGYTPVYTLSNNK
jgi:hypothetical protein